MSLYLIIVPMVIGNFVEKMALEACLKTCSVQVRSDIVQPVNRPIIGPKVDYKFGF